MKNMRITAIAVASLFAVVVFAGGLSKYKNWDKSPEGLLMTSAERGQWSNIKTDDDADKFVKDFLARRGPDFTTNVTRAATNADKYFTVGKVQGSTTERGKLVIILGPPTSVVMNDRQVKGDRRYNVDSAMTVGSASPGSGGGGGQGASVTDMVNAANSAGGLSGTVHVYTFTYSADKLPAAYGKSLTVDIELDPSGTDRFADKKTQAELDRLYEMVAETKLTPPSTK
jgi:GWxTD domain-containing protein